MDGRFYTGDGVVIHASARFPVELTLCGRARDPPPCCAAARWSYVTCVECLRIGAQRSRDPRVRQRFEELAAAPPDS